MNTPQCTLLYFSRWAKLRRKRGMTKRITCVENEPRSDNQIKMKRVKLEACNMV